MKFLNNSKKFLMLLAFICQGSIAQEYFPNLKNHFTLTEMPEELRKDWSHDGLYVFPEAGRKPWIAAIQSAKKSIHMAAYRLSDEKIVAELCKVAKNKEIQVNVLVEPAPQGHAKTTNAENKLDILEGAGIKVALLSKRFNQAHYKLIVIDETWGMIGTGNLDKDSFDGIPNVSKHPCRDFLVTIIDKALIKQALSVLNADIEDKRFIPTFSQIVVGPDEQRSTFLKLINSAKKSIKIYQQDFTDPGITAAVIGAAKAGVNVEIIMMEGPFGPKDNNIPNQQMIKEANGKVYLRNHHYMHAKIVIVDEEDSKNRLMYVGSCNFYTPSIDQTRELGILIKEEAQIKKVVEIFNQDKNTKE